MQILAFGTGCWLASYKLSLQAAAIPQLTCCWRRVTQARRALTPQPSRFCSLWLTPAPPPPRSAPGQAPQGLPSELQDVLLRSTSPSTRSNPVPRPPRENLSFSNSEEELVNKEERGSISENIFSRGSGGAERICWLTAGTGREGKAAGISMREETRSWAMLWAVQEKLSSPTAAHCLSGIRHPLLPQHPTLLSLLAKKHVKHDEPATLKRS